MCLRQCHWRHYEYQRTQLIVPPMALAEAQVVILYFLILKAVNAQIIGFTKTRIKPPLLFYYMYLYLRVFTFIFSSICIVFLFEHSLYESICILIYILSKVFDSMSGYKF